MTPANNGEARVTQERVTLSATFLRHIADLLGESGYDATAESIRAVIAERAALDPATAPLIEAVEAAREALRNYACHAGPDTPCLRSNEQCRQECGKPAGDAFERLTAALAAHRGEG